MSIVQERTPHRLQHLVSQQEGIPYVKELLRQNPRVFFNVDGLFFKNNMFPLNGNSSSELPRLLHQFKQRYNPQIGIATAHTAATASHLLHYIVEPSGLKLNTMLNDYWIVEGGHAIRFPNLPVDKLQVLTEESTLFEMFALEHLLRPDSSQQGWQMVPGTSWAIQICNDHHRGYGTLNAWLSQYTASDEPSSVVDQYVTDLAEKLSLDDLHITVTDTHLRVGQKDIQLETGYDWVFGDSPEQYPIIISDTHCDLPYGVVLTATQAKGGVSEVLEEILR